jgi:hypothetical protein
VNEPMRIPLGPRGGAADDWSRPGGAPDSEPGLEPPGPSPPPGPEPGTGLGASGNDAVSGLEIGRPLTSFLLVVFGGPRESESFFPLRMAEKNPPGFFELAVLTTDCIEGLDLIPPIPLPLPIPPPPPTLPAPLPRSCWSCGYGRLAGRPVGWSVGSICR